MRPDQLLSLAVFFERLAIAGQSQTILNYAKSLASRTPTVAEMKAWEEVNRVVLGGLDPNIVWGSRGQELWGFSRDNWDFPAAIIGPQYFSLGADYQIINDATLMGMTPIPSLKIAWVEPMTPEDSKDGPYYPKEVEHYEWMMDALREMYTINYYSSEENQAIVQFIKQNKDKLNAIRRHFAQPPQRLGAGSDGVAFSIGKDRVLKIFQQKFAYDKALQAVQFLHTRPEVATTETMYYDVGQIGLFEGKPIYYYIQEKLVPLSDLDDDLTLNVKMTNLIGIIDEAMRNRENQITITKLKSEIQQTDNTQIGRNITDLAKKITDQLLAGRLPYVNQTRINNIIGGIQRKFPNKLSNNWLEKLVEEIITKTITGRNDLAPSNMGWQEATHSFRFFDPAYQER